MNIKRTLLLLGVGLLLGAPLFGAGQQEDATELDMPPQPRQYISPQDGGEQDELELPFSTVVVESEDSVIVEYNLTVFDSDGNVVWTESQEEEERVGFFGRLFGAEKPRVEVPESLTWDGTYKDSTLGNDGELVDDGDYTYQLFIRDDQERISRTPPFNVTVDTEAPEVTELGPPDYRIFAPTEDSERDRTTFPQDGSREVEWVGTIRDADGNAVWRTTWENPSERNRSADVSPPSPVTWDGTYKLEDDERNGERVPEGAYTYTLAATDRAGNSTEETADWTITVSLESGGVELAVDEYSAFSPNGDGRKDMLPFSVNLLEPEGVESWELEVRDPRMRNPVVRRVTGEAPVPKQGRFDGMDEEGEPLRDGTYEARMFVQYENGISVSSSVQEFVIDTEAPQAQLSVDTQPQSTPVDAPLVFGGTRKPELAIAAQIDPEVDWTAVIGTPGDEDIVVDLARQGFEGPEIGVEWDGTDLEGNEVPDGEYSLQLRATDNAGNVGRSRKATAIKDTRAAPIDLSIDGDVLSPVRDDVADTVTIFPEYEVEEYIDDFLLEIRNGDGELVRSIYRNQPFDEFEWAGENNIGRMVAEGEYTVDFQIIYYNGNRPQITGVGPIYVDRTEPEPEEPAGPQADMSVGPLPFSPDGDGKNDILTINLSARSEVAIDRWSLEIYDPMTNGFITWSGEGDPPQEITWDGRARDGELVQSAVDYQAEFTVVDSEGNEATVERVVPTDILVTQENGRLVIRLPGIHFAAFSADLFEIEVEEQEENFSTLRRLATVLDRYPEYDILVEGHANHIIYWDEQAMEEEQNETLIPLSRNRAQEVKESLIILGIDRDRMEIKGVGGARPVVPFEDKDHVWKNRRVQFLLEK